MNKQSGFTLIEIIAVLVILGILAAVAIPKYQDLQQTAQRRAMAGMAAAGMSQLTMVYSSALLENNGSKADAESAVSSDVCASNVTLTDGYTMTCAAGTGGITVTAPDSQTFTATWDNPN